MGASSCDLARNRSLKKITCARVDVSQCLVKISIQIKVITEHDDPVELFESEALELAEVHRKFAALLSD